MDVRTNDPTVTSGPDSGREHEARRICARVMAVPGVIFVVLLGLVAGGWGPLVSVDTWIADGLHAEAVEDPAFTHANRILTDWVWDPWAMRALLAVTVLWLLRRGARRQALFLVVCGVAGTVLQQAVKAAVGRERPSWPDPVDSAQYSAFPSGHAMSATVACGALLWLWLSVRGTPAGTGWRGAACTVAVGSVAGVGFTRAYLGVHWASDVLGGWLLGLVVVAGAAAVTSPWRE